MLCANQTKTQYGRTPRMHMAIRCNTVHHYYHRLLDPTHLRVGPPVNDIGSMSERLPGSRIQCRAPVWIQDPVKSVCLDPGSGSERSIVSGNRLNPPARATGCWVVVWVSPFSHGSYILPCYCHATAMPRPCHCHATAMLPPCYCHATAMLPSCYRHATAMPLCWWWVGPHTPPTPYLGDWILSPWPLTPMPTSTGARMQGPWQSQQPILRRQ